MMEDAALVELAQELVRIPSLPGEEKQIAPFLASVMKPIFDSVVVDELYDVIGVLEGTGPGPTVLFNGHTDHVDPASMENPYSGELIDAARFGGSGQAVYGRGSCDMKGAIASMIGAAAELRSTGFNGRIILTAVVQEELVRGAGTKQAMKTVGIVPDVAISGESTKGDVCLGHRGKVEFELVVHGRSAHASNPSRGINAISLMNLFLSAWPSLPMPEDPVVGRCTSAITNISCSPGWLSIVPDRCTLTFDVRYLPSESPERPERDVLALLERIKASNPDFVYELRVKTVMPGYLVPADHPGVDLMSRVVADLSGRVPARRGWLFATDGMFLVPEMGIPTVGYGPGEEIFAHTPMEHVPVADLLLARRVYAEFVRRLGGI